MRWLRFNFTTGDAAGQNMVTKSVHEVCPWILNQQPRGLTDFALAANLETDKKHSSLNNLHTRGKRVVAEATVPAALIEEVLHTSAEDLYRQRQLSNMGSLLSGSISNGPTTRTESQPCRRLRQDVANVAESSAGLSFSEPRPGSYYPSVRSLLSQSPPLAAGPAYRRSVNASRYSAGYGPERVHGVCRDCGGDRALR